MLDSLPQAIDRLGRSSTGSRIPPARLCEEPACGRSTRESKPYCHRHVGRAPYVRSVMERILAREVEAAQVLAGGAATIASRGLLAADIVAALRIHGELQQRDLAVETGIRLEVLRICLEGLEGQGVLVPDPRGKRVRIARLPE